MVLPLSESLGTLEESSDSDELCHFVGGGVCVCVFWYMAFIMLRKFAYISSLLGVFFPAKRYWILSNVFYTSIEMIIFFLSFILLI